MGSVVHVDPMGSVVRAVHVDPKGRGPLFRQKLFLYAK